MATQPSLSSAHAYLALLYQRRQDYQRFLIESRIVAQLRHDSDGLALADAREKGFAGNGLRGMYESELPVQKQQVDRGAGDAYQLAATYAAIGQTQAALNCLQISLDRRESEMLTGEPIPELQNNPTCRQFRVRVREMLAN